MCIEIEKKNVKFRSFCFAILIIKMAFARGLMKFCYSETQINAAKRTWIERIGYL